MGYSRYTKSEEGKKRAQEKHHNTKRGVGEQMQRIKRDDKGSKEKSMEEESGKHQRVMGYLESMEACEGTNGTWQQRRS